MQTQAPPEAAGHDSVGPRRPSPVERGSGHALYFGLLAVPVCGLVVVLTLWSQRGTERMLEVPLTVGLLSAAAVLLAPRRARRLGPELRAAIAIGGAAALVLIAVALSCFVGAPTGTDGAAFAAGVAGLLPLLLAFERASAWIPPVRPVRRRAAWTYAVGSVLVVTVLLAAPVS